MLRILPYKPASASAKALADALQVKRIRREGPTRPVKGGVVVNWGATSSTRELINVELINSFDAISISIDKLATFKALKEAEVKIPKFTEDVVEARGWIDLGGKVVCRTQLRGYGGAGIVIASSYDEIVEAPLYVRYMPKAEEYRVHVFRDRVFFVQRKARRLDVADENVNWAVRNLAGGFIYANQEVVVSAEIEASCISSVFALGLDFGAVDILVTPRGNHAVLEVNSACGLAGTTLNKYVEVFQSLSQG